MRKLVSLAAVFGIGLTGIQSAAQAETWWLMGIYRLDREIETYKVAMDNENDCQVAGAKLAASTEKGNLSRLARSGIFPRFAFECIRGK